MSPLPTDTLAHQAPPELEWCKCVCGESATTGKRIVGRDEVHGGIFHYEACARCGTERVAPRPGPSNIAHYYPNTYYAYAGPSQALPSWSDRLKRVVYELYYAEPAQRAQLAGWQRTLLWPVLYPLRFRTNLAFRAPRERRVFEIGAATGTDLLEFRAAGWDVTGCEPSAKACEVAQRRGVTLQNCTAEAAVLAANRYGCVLINNVFEHLHDPVRVLAKVREGLVEGGALVLIVPNHASWTARTFGAAWPGYDPPRHLWGFTPQSLRALLTQAGFTVEYIAHKAPQRWCWEASIAGTRLPGGATPLRYRLSRLLPTLALPWGALLAFFGRGDFIKVVARNPRATPLPPPAGDPVA